MAAMDVFNMSNDELREHNRSHVTARLRTLHVAVTLRRPAAIQHWDDYVTFLRSKYQTYSDDEVDAFITEVRSKPVTNIERDPAAYQSLKRLQQAQEAERAGRAARTPEETRRHRKSLAAGFSLIALFWAVVIGGWLLL